mgnify:FL=1
MTFLTRDELLALSSTRLAAHYRTTLAWVRARPSHEQWRHGEYLSLVRRAFSVALEAERSVAP